jgi:O-antigen/teichoic acid export membrane protein
VTTSAPGPRRSRLRQLLSESTLYTLGNVARRSFSLVTMPVFTRYLSTSGYGILSIVGTVQNMLEVFYELGMG